jgi:hypothetical protein
MDIRVSLFYKVLDTYPQEQRHILIKKIKQLDLRCFKNKTYRQIRYTIINHFERVSPSLYEFEFDSMVEAVCKLFRVRKRVTA